MERRPSDEPGTSMPPSNSHVWPRLYLLSVYGWYPRSHRIVAVYVDMVMRRPMNLQMSATVEVADSDRGTQASLRLCQLPFSPSRKAIASSSTRTASITGTTGRASNTNAGSIEQNL